MKILPATEVKNRFGRVLSEVYKGGGPLIVEKSGKPVMVLMSFQQYQQMKAVPQPIDQDDLFLSAFGMWRDRPELDGDWLADGRSRWRSAWHEDES